MDLEHFQPGPRVRNALISAAIAYARSRLRGAALANLENNLVGALNQGFQQFRQALGQYLPEGEVQNIVQQGFGYYRDQNDRAGQSILGDTPPNSARGSLDNTHQQSQVEQQLEQPGSSNRMDTSDQRNSQLQRRRTADDAGLGPIDEPEAAAAPGGGGGNSGTGGGGTGSLKLVCTDYRQFFNVDTHPFSKRTLLSFISFVPVWRVSGSLSKKQGYYTHCVYMFIPHGRMWATKGVEDWMEELVTNGYEMEWVDINMKLSQQNFSTTFVTNTTTSQSGVNSNPTGMIGHARGLEQDIITKADVITVNGTADGITAVGGGFADFRRLELPKGSTTGIGENTFEKVEYGFGSCNYQRYTQVCSTPCVTTVATNATVATLDEASVIDIGERFPLLSNISAAGEIFNSKIKNCPISFQQQAKEHMFPVVGENYTGDFVLAGTQTWGQTPRVQDRALAGTTKGVNTTVENAYIDNETQLIHGLIHGEGNNPHLHVPPRDYVILVPSYGTDPSEPQPATFYGIFEASASLKISRDLGYNKNSKQRVNMAGIKKGTAVVSQALQQQIYRGQVAASSSSVTTASGIIPPVKRFSNILDPTKHAFLQGTLHKTINVPETALNQIPSVNIWVFYREAGSTSKWEIRPQSIISIGGGINLTIPPASGQLLDPVNKAVYSNPWIGGGSSFELNSRWMYWDNITYNGVTYVNNLLCPYCSLNTGGTQSPGNRGFYFPSATALKEYLSTYRSDWGLATGLWIN
ncbi:Uncharacterized protein APZ42_031457 [Daphnia magna]|uniref:Uncharacterized protein n=1 Tax=Daphnia magna TaxID=35525 RepID=A0A162DBH0_9CRUS|nr:Uncharacterized protein APZ42_031457 [Daphnia magna]